LQCNCCGGGKEQQNIKEHDKKKQKSCFKTKLRGSLGKKIYQGQENEMKKKKICIVTGLKRRNKNWRVHSRLA
jgi:hypothetical protein